MSVPVVLNGRRTVLDCAPSAMLLDALRDGEGLTSVRATCGIGVCGACTVLLDGEPVTGCLTMAGQAEGRAITTLEGLGGSDPVQRAFAAEHAYQCGWCTPGFVLTVKRLLEEDPGGWAEASDAEIAEALGGNLCRCGSYVNIAAAVRRAAKEQRA